MRSPGPAAWREEAALLPALSQAELCALGAASKSLVCERTWAWWTGLGERERASLASSSLELLAVRGLLRPGGGAGAVAPAPELAVILTARTRPEPVVTCQVPGQDAALEPRFFGLTDRQRGLRRLVCETLTDETAAPGGQHEFGTVLRYALLTPARAARALAGWARTAAGPASAQPPVIDVFGHDTEGRFRHDRLQVRADGECFDARRDAIPPGRFDEMGLCQMLENMLTGAAR